MAWTTPATQTTGTLITASIYNNQIINNLQFLYDRVEQIVVGEMKFAWRTADIDINKWLLCDGRQIGSAASGATGRANSDMQTLFEHLWGFTGVGFSFFTLTYLTSAGGSVVNPGNFTPSQAWANNYRITIPDMRGRLAAGMDQPLGGSAAGRVTSAAADDLGGTQGAEDHTLTEAELASHRHTINSRVDSGGAATAISFSQSAGGLFALKDQPAGGNGAHNNIQPTLFASWLIYTGL